MESSMNLYRILSLGYDLLDRWWLSDNGINPREAVLSVIPNRKCMVLDMCCGTFSNGLSIAKNNPNNRVVGLDRSKEMLRGARRKIRKEGLINAKLICKDATETGLRCESFDYIVLGLVLHECNTRLWSGILSEAHRLLKPNGKLIILEWDEQTRISRKIKFAPLFLMEVIANRKYFRRFYYSDKRKFFIKYRFQVVTEQKCNYTSVMSLQRV